MNRIYARAKLSRRETEVLRLLGDGKTTPEIAAKFKISLKTVQQYCARLKQKLDEAKFSRLVRIAILWRAGVAEIVVREAFGGSETFHCHPALLIGCAHHFSGDRIELFARIVERGRSYLREMARGLALAVLQYERKASVCLRLVDCAAQFLHS